MTIESFVITICFFFLAVFAYLFVAFSVELYYVVKEIIMKESDWEKEKTSIYLELLVRQQRERDELNNKINSIQQARQTPDAVAIRNKLYGEVKRGDTET